MTEDELRAHFQSLTGFQKGQHIPDKVLTEKWKFTPSYLRDVLNGYRSIGGQLANALGFDRVVTFVPKGKP